MKHKVQCDCCTVEIAIAGSPIVHAYCHCVDCREFIKAAFSAVTAWKEDCVEITNGEESLTEFEHPQKQMKRQFCSKCGETLFYTNSLGWCVISQILIEKCEGFLPTDFMSNKHIFYEQRIINIDDSLPKYLRGSNSQICSGV